MPSVIARWFNEAFYDNSLDVLTDVTAFGKGQRGLVWIDVEGLAERGRFGVSAISPRLTWSWTVFKSCSRRMPRSESSAPSRRKPRESRARRSVAWERRAGTATSPLGTAHRLQGNEREVVVFSTVVAPGISPRTAQWVERERNLVNVAASRAQRAFIVVGHPTAAAELQVHTIESLRRAALEGLEPPSAAWRIDSEAEQRLVEALHIAGFAPLVK